MSGWPGNQGDPNQNQQYYYDDGNTRISYSSSTWTTVQPGTPIQTPVPMMPQPQMIQSPDFGQMQQMHMNMHQATIQNPFNSMRSNFNNTTPMFQPQQPALMPASPLPQRQIEYFEEDKPLMEQFDANSPQRQVEYNQPPPNQPQYTELATSQAMNDARDDERRKELIRETSKLEKRLQRMEQSQSQNQEQQQAKEREIAAGRAREEQLQQQMLELEQRHSQQIADMAKAQAAIPQSSPAFDMDMLQKMIMQAQSDKISKEDIKHLIENSVQQQLSGIAKASDIESAASRMERGLNRAPKGVSADELQQTIQKELANAVSQVARYAAKSQKTIEQPPMQPQVFNGGSATQIWTESSVKTLPKQQPMPIPQQNVANYPIQLQSIPAASSNIAPPSASRRSYPQQNVHGGDSTGAVKQLPAPSSDKQYKQSRAVPSAAPANEAPVRKPKQLLAPPVQDSQPTVSLTEGALAKLTLDNGGEAEPSKSRHSKTRASVMPTPENTLVRTKHREGESRNAPKMSTASFQTSASNTAAKMSTTGLENSHREHKEHKSSKKSTISVQPSQDNALVRPGHESSHRDHSSVKKSTMSVQSTANPGSMAGLRPRNDRRDEVSAHPPPRRIESIPEEDEGSSGALMKHKGDKTKKS